MNTRLVKVCAASALAMALAVVSSAASASYITYNFYTVTNTTLTPSMEFTGSDGSTVTATALFSTAPTESPNGLGVVSGYGIYVCSESPCGFYESLGDGRDYYPIDGMDTINEGVRFDGFDSGPLQLVSASFWVYSADNTSSNDFDLVVDGSLLLNEQSFSACSSYYVGSWSLSGYVKSCDLLGLAGDANDLIGSSFAFWADGNTDAFKIKSLTFQTVGVPEPGMLMLLGSSLLLIGYVGRRRRLAIA